MDMKLVLAPPRSGIDREHDGVALERLLAPL